jgi:hypothetical protein
MKLVLQRMVKQQLPHRLATLQETVQQRSTFDFGMRHSTGCTIQL